MDEHELADRAHALPDRFADRIEASDLAHIRSAARGGEWTEEVDNLLACLQNGGRSITTDERDEIQAVLDALKAPDGAFDVPAGSQTPQDRLNTLNVAG